MPYRVNLPPFDASGRVYSSSLYLQKAETAETTETDPHAERNRLYYERFMDAISRIRANPVPAECLPWLAENHAGLYRLLTVALQDKLQEVWDTPGFHLPAFEWVLDRILDAQRRARELHAEYLQKPARC